jgi:hypothetical protein
MRIPRKDTAKFVREVADQCFSSRVDRTNRGSFFSSFFNTGSNDPSTPAMYNKVYSSIDDLESLLFSPVSLRFHIGDPDVPNILNEAKGRAAASRLRQKIRQAGADSLIPQSLNSALVKGLGLTKQMYRDNGLHTFLVQPEDFGVWREDHTKLDKDMEAFSQSMLITKFQFDRLVQGRSDEAELRAKSRRYLRETTGGMMETGGSAMNIVVGGVQPFSAAGAGTSQFRGVVDWMSQPKPSVDPNIVTQMLELHEVWIWDDIRDDWATFQIIGDEILILGRYQILNAFAHDPKTNITAPSLKGMHPFNSWCVNPVPGYFWGFSEIARLVLLQEAINARIIGINKRLRMQEDPTTKFIGSTGVNQQAVSRFRKPGGYWSDSNPNAKVETENVTLPPDMFASLHEYERMFDELMGLPPIAKGQGDAGVRSAEHAETLVRMFSPRFKDRALLVERDVESFGALALDLSRAHDAKKLIAWVPKGAAGVEGDEEMAQVLQAPAPNMVPVFYTYDDLPDDVRLTVDSHSSSPAFAQEAKTLAFDLAKIGAMSPADVVERMDVTDPDELLAGITRREIAKAEAEKQALAVKLAMHKQSTAGHKK